MEYEAICVVKMVRPKLEVMFASEPEGFQGLVEGGIRYQFRTFDGSGLPQNWLKLNLYDDARNGQPKLESGIRGFFEAETSKIAADKKRIKIRLELYWNTLKEAPLDTIKEAMHAERQSLPDNYYIDIGYMLDNLPDPGKQHIRIQGQQTCIIEPVAVIRKCADT